MTFHLARDTELVEGALGHAREDEDHGVDPLLLVTLHEGHHVDTEREERSIEEPIHQKHLTWNMQNEYEHLTIIYLTYRFVRYFKCNIKQIQV